MRDEKMLLNELSNLEIKSYPTEKIAYNFIKKLQKRISYGRL